tara:strand:- start:3463 stop:4923 length:1461 start_codon:yes stop_codon:yes gene_type:complete
MHKSFGAGLLAATLALGGCNNDDDSNSKEDDLRAKVPRIEAAAGGAGEAALAADLQFAMDSAGYSEKEFILSGTAVSYLPKGGLSLGTGGRWDVEENDSAAYITRAVVYQPLDAEAFNGTVIVEWMNVTSGSDSSPVWTYTHNELIREGYALISLSAQAAGVASTKTMDPERYASLLHPGDNYSYDIFSQAGQAVRDHADVLLNGLQPKRVLAAGESQSAYRLVSYVNAVHPLVTVYDGYLLQSRLANAAPLAVADDVSGSTEIRSDLGVPVLMFQTETDVNEATRQADTSTYRLWEVAGTAHFDVYGGGIGLIDTGHGEGAVLALEALLDPPSTVFGFINCDKPINAGPMSFVLSAAVHALNEWVTTGTPPASAETLQATDFVPYSPVYARDAQGNALGGIRTPFVDVPLAALSGTGNTGGGGFCLLFGTTEPLSAGELDTLYPTQEAFVTAWTAATEAAVERGHIRPVDGQALIDAAARVQILP